MRAFAEWGAALGACVVLIGFPFGFCFGLFLALACSLVTVLVEVVAVADVVA